MKSPKFKVGDEVVVIKEFENYGYSLGSVGVIEKIEPIEYSHGIMYQVDFGKVHSEPVYELEIELSVVINSPLWRALT